MKQYEFEEVVMGGLFGSRTVAHETIIKRRAAEGWRYAGWVPLSESAHGVTQAISLIFEKDAEEAE